MTHLIFGCGDVGRRIVKYLIEADIAESRMKAFVNSKSSKAKSDALGVETEIIDLDNLDKDLSWCDNADVYYTVAPQKSGEEDLRTRAVIDHLESCKYTPNKVVLISTTGVYGDHEGEWVDELSRTEPQTDRGKRRLNLEQQWLQWGGRNSVAVTILRAPGIYAHSRIPVARITKRTPVVSESECGFTNRIHADDLARACILAMQKGPHGQVYNATDGKTGKITEYLQAATKVLGLEPLPEISMAQAKEQLSEGMLSYLSESRKISNRKLIEELEFTLLYPDFMIGLWH